jgi:pro-kumamolisin-like protein/Big-like domain-containing protein
LRGCIAKTALKCTLNLFSGRAVKITKLSYRVARLLAGLLLIISANGAGAQTQPVRARITEAVDETNRLQLRGNVHPLAQAEFDQGVVADSQPMNRMLLLLQRSPEQEAALSKLMEEQLTKGAANYHKWLTSEDFGKQFGPANADIQAVTAWLGSHGFQGIKIGPGQMVMEFSGTAGHVRNAFHTEMHHYLVNGEAHMANASDPQIPAALAPVVAGIRSLHNFKPKSHRQTVGTFRRDKETGKVEPLLTTTKGCGANGSQPCFAVTPADFAKIYGIAPGFDGTGQAIAIVADSNINPNDITSFRNLFGLLGNNLRIILNGPDPGIAADEGEADLDVEWSGAVAPNATIDLVVSEGTASTAGFDLSALYIVENDLAPVLSDSFGVCEPGLGTSGNAFYKTLWEQAAAQGITVMVSAGDGGSDGCDDFNTATVATSGIAVSGTASTPFNVAVGGTDFDDVGKQSQFWNTNNGIGLESAKGYIPESTWNDSCAATATAGSLATCVNPSDKATLNIVGGSGGPSAVNPKPFWQNSITPNDGARDTPDVSLFASDGHNGSFYVVCQADAVMTPSSSCASSGTFEFVGVGGTSASSPAFAGIMAIINQKTNQRQGNANVVLYQLARAENFSACDSSKQTHPNVPPSPACVFNDITNGDDSVPCAGGSPNCSSTTANTNGVLVNSAKVPAFKTSIGYDLATGLGSVNVANLAAAWATFEAALKPTSVTLASVPASLTGLTHGKTQVTFAIKVAPNPAAAGTPSGEVSLLTDANPNLNPPSSGVLGEGAAILDGSGSATISTNSLPGGSYNVSVHYPGDNAFGPSDSSKIPVTVTPEQSQLQLDLLSSSANNTVTINPTSLVYGSSYILRADILKSSGQPCQPFLQGGITAGCATDATGTVKITDNGSLAAPNGGTFAFNSLGHTENQPIQLVPGKQTLVATYSGDSSYIAPANPITLVVNVTQAGTTTTVTASPTSIASGGTVTLTATVTSTQFSGDAPGAPGGKVLATPVQFLNGTTPISGMVQLTASPGATNSPSLTATLKTTLSALGIPDPGSPWRPKLPPGMFWLLGCCAALYGLFVWKMPRASRRGYAYAGLAVFALAAAGIAGCGGGGGSSKTPQTKTVTITAKFIGDSNYTASSNTTTVTIQ